MSSTPHPRIRPQQILRADDRTGTRATPRQDLICAHCGSRFRIWTEHAPCQGFDLVAQCPHCNAWLQLRLVITEVPAPAPAHRPRDPLRNHGRARKSDPLRAARQEYRNERNLARNRWSSGEFAPLRTIIENLVPSVSNPDGGEKCPSR